RCAAASIDSWERSSSSRIIRPRASAIRPTSGPCGRTCSGWRKNTCRIDPHAPAGPQGRAAMTDTLSRPTGAVGEGPTPPQALDAERSVLAAMLIDHEAVGRAIEMMDTGDFYRVAHQKIFEAILSIYNRNEKADLITLAEELRKRGELEMVGGMAALSQIL